MFRKQSRVLVVELAVQGKMMSENSRTCVRCVVRGAYILPLLQSRCERDCDICLLVFSDVQYMQTTTIVDNK